MPEYLMPVLGLTMVELGQLFSGTDPVDPEELWKAQMQIRGQHLIAGEDSSTRMSRLVTQELYFGKHLPATDIMAKIEAVDSDALAHVSADLLSSMGQATVAVVGPQAAESYDQVAIEELMSDFR